MLALAISWEASMKTLFATAAAVAALAFAGSAGAAIVMTTGNFGSNGVHSDADVTAATVTGHVGTDLVTLSTDFPDLLNPSNGQGESTFAADDGAMDDLNIAFTFNYDAVTFNLGLPHNGTTGFTLVLNGVNDVFHTFTAAMTGNGQHQFRLDATGTDFIHSLAFTFTGSLASDIRQIRVGNIVGEINPHDGVPEAATWAMMLVGFGGLGAMLRRRRAALA
jgi:hypothetical protein